MYSGRHRRRQRQTGIVRGYIYYALPSRAEALRPPSKPAPYLKEGDRVEHPIRGMGTVLSPRAPASYMVNVRFDGCGIRVVDSLDLTVLPREESSKERSM